MIIGRCECNAVQIELVGEINDFSHCHCSQCRRLHGAAFATFAGVAKKDFRYINGSEYVKSYASSSTHERLFCHHCGSNIMVKLDDDPENFYIAMGIIDGNPDLPEAYHIFVDSKAPWYEIADNAEKYRAFPDDD